MAVADLAARAGASTSTIHRLEKGDAGVGLGTLADVLVVLGLVERLADLIDVRSDDLGLALAEERLPKRGRSLTLRRRGRSADRLSGTSGGEDIDPDGAAF